MATSGDEWGPAQRAALAEAMRAAGHDEEECAVTLREEFGLQNASQPNVNRWKSGAIKRPGCIEALRAYIQRYAPDIPVSQSQSADFRDRSASFEQLAGLAANQPLLGPDQQRLMTAVAHRLMHGPPMSPDDYRVFLLQAKLLGLTTN